MNNRQPVKSFVTATLLAGALTLLCGSMALAASKPAAAPTDLNGTWAGPTPTFTDDGIPEPPVTRDVPWAPFSEGLPENRKAPPPEEQIKKREAMMKMFREISNSGKNVFAPNGPAAAMFGGARGAALLTSSGSAALKAAMAASPTAKIPLSDVNSLLHCYPQNHLGLGSPVTIVQSSKAIVFLASNSARLVYLDGRTFQNAPLTDYLGYSIGHWEGPVLVVETRKFRAPTVLLQGLGPMPLSDDTKVTEYISKTEGGKTLQVKTVFEDSMFLKEKAGRMEYLSWAPDETPVNEDCVEGLTGQIDYDPAKFKAE